MISRNFLGPSPLKPLKTSLGYQNLPGVLSRPHSDHQGPVSAQVYLNKMKFWPLYAHPKPQRPTQVCPCVSLYDLIHAISIWYRYNIDTISI